MGYKEIIIKPTLSGVIVIGLATALRNHIDDGIVRSAIPWLTAVMIWDAVKESMSRRNQKGKSVE